MIRNKLTRFRQMNQVGLEGPTRAHQGKRTSVYQKVGIVAVCICLLEWKTNYARGNSSLTTSSRDLAIGAMELAGKALCTRQCWSNKREQY